jgi:S1-C subfamily serine protease
MRGAMAMIQLVRGIFFLLVFLSLQGPVFAGFVSDDIPEQIHSLTVKLSGRNGESGTGVVVKGDEAKNRVIVMTAGHTLEGMDAISVRFSNGESREANVLYRNQEMDYALLEASEIFLPVHITYPDRRRTEGSNIFVIGYSGLFQYAISHGIISTYAGNLLHTDANATFGSSGSGVWDRWGRLIGLVIQVSVEEVSSGSDRFLMQRQTIAVDILRIRDDLKQHGFNFLD